MTNKLNWNLLKSFVSVARNGTLQQAADELFVTSGAVSKQLATLEETLGERLFEREARGLMLTDRGRQLLISIRGPMAELECALAPWAGIGTAVTVKISSAPSIAAHVLSGLIHGMFARFPEVRFDMTTTLRVVSLVDEAWDIGLRIGRGDWRDTDVTELPGSELILIAGAGVKQIEGAPILQHESADEWESWLRIVGGDAIRPGRVIMMDDWNFILTAVTRNAGVALVPRLLALASLEKGTVRQLSTVSVPGRLRFYIASAPQNYPHRMRKSPFAGAVKEWLSAEIAALARI